MKLNNVFSLLFIATLIFASCAGDKSKVTISNSDSGAKKEQVKGNKVKPSKAGYFVDLKTHIGLSDQQLYEVKVIISRTGKVKNDFIADGKWEGPENEKTRDEWRNGQRAELRELLGNELFKKKLVFDNQYFKAIQ